MFDLGNCLYVKWMIHEMDAILKCKTTGYVCKESHCLTWAVDYKLITVCNVMCCVF